MIRGRLPPEQIGSPYTRMPTSFRHLRIATALVLGVLVVGTIGYMWIEHLSFLDALYTTVDMMATIGSKSYPITPQGRIFTLLIVAFGVGSLLYTFAVGMEFLLEGHFNQVVRRRLMDRKIVALRQHCIICGFGRVGLRIAEDFVDARKPFIVLDDKDENIQICLERGYLALQGDATRDDLLREAGIQHAQCVLVATENDAHNISITLSARHLNSKLLIIARANHDETEVKLKLAGANRVLSPYTISGHYMANMVFESAMVELFEAIMQAGNTELLVASIPLSPASPLSGKTMATAQRMLLHHGLVLVALRRGDRVLAGPDEGLLVTEGDVAVVVGMTEQITSFRAENTGR